MFGATGLFCAFVIGQTLVLAKYMQEPGQEQGRGDA
jgi:hypothetical protein